MQLHVSLLPSDVPDFARVEESLAIVVDTFRFTTAACQALTSGAQQLTTCGTVEDARRLAGTSRQASGRPLLCGERECKPIPGFDLGNSPFEYSPESVKGRQLIFTTTNGTKAVEAAGICSETWLSALTNRHAICQAVDAGDVDHLWIICSGTNGRPSLEDIVTAGALTVELANKTSDQHLNDGAIVAKMAWLEVSRWENSSKSLGELEPHLARKLKEGAGGKNVCEAGYSRDIEFAVRIDSCDCIPTNLLTESKQTFKARASGTK